MKNIVRAKFKREFMIVRPAVAQDAAGIAAVHVQSWEEHYRGILPDEVIASRTLEQRLNIWRAALEDPNRVTYVWCADGGDIAGFASAIVFMPPQEDFDSYLQTIYLLSGVKAKGVGRSLMQALAQDLISRGCKTMSLRVLSKNPARGFYERLGARLVPEGISLDAGAFPDSVVYAFDDLKDLTRSAR